MLKTVALSARGGARDRRRLASLRGAAVGRRPPVRARCPRDRQPCCCGRSGCGLCGVALSALIAAWRRVLGLSARTLARRRRLLRTARLAVLARLPRLLRLPAPDRPDGRIRQMHSVILVAIFGFTLAVALAVASRRALLAVVFFFIGAGWPATLLSGGNELGRGIAILAVALALLAGMTERPSKLALIATGAVHRVRAGALEFSGGREERVPRLAALGLLHAPTKAGERQATSGMRATTAFSFRRRGRPCSRSARRIGPTTGAPPSSIASTERAGSSTCGVKLHSQRRQLEPPAARDRANLVRQEVTVAALEDNHVIGASMPISNDLRDRAAYEGQGVALASSAGSQRGEHYSGLRATRHADSGGARARCRRCIQGRSPGPRASSTSRRESPRCLSLFAGPRRLYREQLTGRLHPYAAALRARAGRRGRDELAVRGGRRARSLVQIDGRLHLLRAARADSRTAAARRLRRRTRRPATASTSRERWR